MEMILERWTEKYPKNATFEIMILNVCGDDEDLNDLLEELEYISGIEVLSRHDSEDGKGVLVIQALQYAKKAILKLATKYELIVN